MTSLSDEVVLAIIISVVTTTLFLIVYGLCVLAKKYVKCLGHNREGYVVNSEEEVELHGHQDALNQHPQQLSSVQDRPPDYTEECADLPPLYSEVCTRPLHPECTYICGQTSALQYAGQFSQLPPLQYTKERSAMLLHQHKEFRGQSPPPQCMEMSEISALPTASGTMRLSSCSGTASLLSTSTTISDSIRSSSYA